MARPPRPPHDPPVPDPTKDNLDACRRCELWKHAAQAVPGGGGATALNGVMGGKMKVGEAREENLKHPSGVPVVASYHPSAALRVPDSEARAQIYATIVGDLKRAAAVDDRAKP